MFDRSAKTRAAGWADVTPPVAKGVTYVVSVRVTISGGLNDLSKSGIPVVAATLITLLSLKTVLLTPFRKIVLF